MHYQDRTVGSKKAAGVRLGFCIHLAAYVAVNSMLVAINLLTTPERLWCWWPLAGWGVGLVAHAVATFAVTRNRTPGAG